MEYLADDGNTYRQPRPGESRRRQYGNEASPGGGELLPSAVAAAARSCSRPNHCCSLDLDWVGGWMTRCVLVLEVLDNASIKLSMS